jgi:putative membrane protein
VRFVCVALGFYTGAKYTRPAQQSSSWRSAQWRRFYTRKEIMLPLHGYSPRGAEMTTAANIVIAVIAVLHLGFLVLEMFLWNHPVGRKTFGMTKEVSESSATLAANQGLYNGFLAAGLIWGLVSGQFSVKIFFLICILIAGIFGGVTAKRSILYIQALPALLGLILLYLSNM